MLNQKNTLEIVRERQKASTLPVGFETHKNLHALYKQKLTRE